ncbi:MAG: nucleotidyltransferase family protein [Sphingomonas sp.]
MFAPEQVALVLLAAGRARRFKGGDKLCEPFLGRPLGFHVVVALEAVPFCTRIAVVSRTMLDFARLGYRVVENRNPSLGRARSLSRGVEAAQALGAEAVLVALADMPRVTATHVYRLMDAAEGPGAMVASSDGVGPMAPALFGRDHFEALLALEDDRAGRDLIRGGRHVIASPAELVDINTREDLEALRALYRPARL